MTTSSHPPMHSPFTLSLLALLFVFSFSATPAAAIAPKPVVEALEKLGKLAGRVPSRSAAEALETAFRAQGRTMLQAAEHGGLDLVEAAARHGDEVFNLASRNPEAVRYIAAQPAEALSLAARFGDDAVRLEARVPGMAEAVVREFGQPALRGLKDAAPTDIVRLTGLAARAESTATREALLNSFKRHGTKLLDELEKHKLLILTTGLTVGIVNASSGVGDGLKGFLGNLAGPIADDLGSAAIISLTTLALGLSAALVLYTWLRGRRAR